METSWTCQLHWIKWKLNKLKYHKKNSTIAPPSAGDESISTNLNLNGNAFLLPVYSESSTKVVSFTHCKLKHSAFFRIYDINYSEIPRYW